MAPNKKNTGKAPKKADAASFTTPKKKKGDGFAELDTPTKRELEGKLNTGSSKKEVIAAAKKHAEEVVNNSPLRVNKKALKKHAPYTEYFTGLLSDKRKRLLEEDDDDEAKYQGMVEKKRKVSSNSLNDRLKAAAASRKSSESKDKDKEEDDEDAEDDEDDEDDKDGDEGNAGTDNLWSAYGRKRNA